MFAPTVPLNVQFCAGAKTDHAPFAETLALTPPYPVTEIWLKPGAAKPTSEAIKIQKELQRPRNKNSANDHPAYDKRYVGILSESSDVDV